MRRRDDWRPRIQGTNEEFSFCDEYDFCLSVSRSLFDTNARWIIIFHRGRLAVVSLDHLFLIVTFWMTMLFLTPRFEKTRETHHRGRMKTRVFLSVCLSVSLSRARASWQRRANDTQQKPSSHKKRDGRKSVASVVVSQPRKKKQSSIKFARRLKRREKKKKRTRANAFCLFYAQFYA